MKYAISALFLLTACHVPQTPSERIVTLAKLTTASANLALTYTKNCKQKAFDDPCRDNLPKINKAADLIETTLEQAKSVFLTEDARYYDLSETVVKNAVKELESLTGEKIDATE
jgi:hypothetical protein